MQATPSASQEAFPSTIAGSVDQQEREGFDAPMLPILPQQDCGKPRKAPTITPRSFTRFFTPKTSFERGGRLGASRSALRDITASGANRKRRRTPKTDSILVENISYGIVTPISTKRKRYTPPSPDPTPEISSPLKRIRNQSLEILEDDGREGDTSMSDDDEEDEGAHSDYSHATRYEHTRRIIHSSYQSRLGRGLNREIGGHINKSWTLHAVEGNIQSNEHQHETASFYTRPKDTHSCYNISAPSDHTIPFCTASCNTNSLVAIGDEDGGIRLLESARDEKPGFSMPWLTFRPHSNAILDLDFSPDDLRLATASGDQTSMIIDMPTQRAVFTMAGHLSSVKQVRFQPESSDVLATSSRDGSVQIWDLRCKGLDAPVRDLLVPMNPTATTTGEASREAHKMTWARSVNTIFGAHALRQTPSISNQPSANGTTLRTPSSFDAPSRTEAPGRRSDVSITTLAFLPAQRSHLLLTGSEANASVKLWDLRATHKSRRSSRTATALSSTRQPESHNRHRHFGLTSLSLSGDGARLYTLCRDNTVYAYSISHLILGSAPELCIPTTSIESKRSRSNGREKEGLGPLYGFRHPSFHATTFYVSSAVRPAGTDSSELLAVGSSDGCAVVFPTDERYMDPRRNCAPQTPDPTVNDMPNSRRRLGLTRTDSGLSGRLNDTIPIYQHGTALVRGHSKEVTSLTWTKDGELVTVGDDFGVRCWRESDREAARGLRIGGETEGRRWGCGWADVEDEWDGDDEY